jgi:cellulose synthase operon protein C
MALQTLSLGQYTITSHSPNIVDPEVVVMVDPSFCHFVEDSALNTNFPGIASLDRCSKHQAGFDCAGKAVHSYVMTHVGSAGRPSLTIFVAVALASLAASPAFADIKSAQDSFTRGDYKATEQQIAAATSVDKRAAQLLSARLQATRGEYAAAIATVSALVGTDIIGTTARVLRAEVWRTIGKYDDARKDMLALTTEQPQNRAARRVLLLASLDRGDATMAKLLIAKTNEEYNKKKLDLDKVEDLWMLAESARANAEHELANDSYQEIQKIDPTQFEAGLRWAELFSEKYADQLAAQTAEEIIKLNPHHPDANAALAALILETSYDLAAFEKRIAEVRSVNPNNVRALLAQASIAIDRNDWKQALSTLDKVLQINPSNTEAIALKATVAWVRDDNAIYETERKRALAINPAFARFYRIVARTANREHRYKELVELEKQAVALDPNAFDAMGGVGLGYLRLGMEKEGVEWLTRAWKGDKYNVRTYNSLDLFNKTIARDYRTVTTKSFKIRYHNDEQAVLSRYLEPTMERAFADMSKRYGFTPKTPVVLELYQNKDDFGIRTSGLPDLGALGVCFGQVITAMSPSNGDINWGMVLWHELGHVFAIQLSNSRVPRWFTEGLSEYETLRVRPDWRRENDADLYGALANGTLPSIADLNSEFMQPDSSAVVVAYYLSAVTIEYLVQTYGFDKIVDALKAFGKGKANNDVLTSMTGKSIAQLDIDFRKYLVQRLAAYKNTFKLPTRGFDDITKLEIAVDAAAGKAAKIKAGAQANLALGHYYDGDAEKATAAAKRAIAIDAKQPMARFVLAEATLSAGDAPTAAQIFSNLIADGFDSYDIRTKLAQIAKGASDKPGFEAQLCKAKQLDPERSYPYQALATFYDAAGNTDKSLAETEQYAALEQMELAPLKTLVAGYTKLGRWDKVRTYGEMAMFINPSDPDILTGLGKAYLEAKDGQRALFTFDTALLVQPTIRRPALAHFGRARALLLLGKKAEAKAAWTEGVKTEPEHIDAGQLKTLLK